MHKFEPRLWPLTLFPLQTYTHSHKRLERAFNSIFAQPIHVFFRIKYKHTHTTKYPFINIFPTSPLIGFFDNPDGLITCAAINHYASPFFLTAASNAHKINSPYNNGSRQNMELAILSTSLHSSPLSAT